MPWDFGAGVAAAAGAGAGLIGDSIKRERNLEDATNLEALKSKIEQDKRDAIAAIVNGVSRTKTVPQMGPTADGTPMTETTQQQKSEHEYAREVGDALTSKGLITDAGKFYDRADRHEDKTERRETAAAAQKSADEKWKTTEARQDKLLDETLRHNKAMEARTAAEKISPAARAQLELAATHVKSAHLEEAAAAKALDAVRKNVAADPAQVATLEADYKASKAATASALKMYDEFGAAHFGEQWKKASVAAPAADNGKPIEIKYKGTTAYKMGADGKPVPATAEEVARAAKKPDTPAAATSEKPAAPAATGGGIINDWSKDLSRANPINRAALDKLADLKNRLAYLRGEGGGTEATIADVDRQLKDAQAEVNRLAFQ